MTKTEQKRSNPFNILQVSVLFRDRSPEVLVLYLERPHETVRVPLLSGRALLIQRLEGSRPQGSLCILNGADRVR